MRREPQKRHSSEQRDCARWLFNRGMRIRFIAARLGVVEQTVWSWIRKSRTSRSKEMLDRAAPLPPHWTSEQVNRRVQYWRSRGMMRKELARLTGRTISGMGNQRWLDGTRARDRHYDRLWTLAEAYFNLPSPEEGK